MKVTTDDRLGAWYQSGKIMLGTFGELHKSTNGYDFKGLVPNTLKGDNLLPNFDESFNHIDPDVFENIFDDIFYEESELTLDGIDISGFKDSEVEILSELGNTSDYVKSPTGFKLSIGKYLKIVYSFESLFIDKLNLFQTLSSNVDKLEIALAHPETLPPEIFQTNIVAEYDSEWNIVKYASLSELSYLIKYAVYDSLGNFKSYKFLSGNCIEGYVEVPKVDDELYSITHILLRYQP